jgi:anthranilate phosphoribosyltransferase
VVAAGGVKVAKHGNRSVSSKCGAADLLEALGANLKTSPERAKEIFDKCGFVFLHAQVYHPAMKYAGPVRGQLGIRTVFNVLGPLANPAGAKYQLLGVYSREMVKPLAEVLAALGVQRLIAVHGEEGLDEVSPSGKTYCCSIFGGDVKEFTVTPDTFGLSPHTKGEITGGDPERNAAIMYEVLGGKKGAYRDAVVANSAMSFYIAGKVNTFEEGARLAEKIIDGGAALNKLNEYISLTRES